MYLPGGLQQFAREEQEILAFRGQFPRSFLVCRQEPVGDDGGPDRPAEGQVGRQGRVGLGVVVLRGHAEPPKAAWAKACSDAIEYGLNFSTCSIGHSISR